MKQIISKNKNTIIHIAVFFLISLLFTLAIGLFKVNMCDTDAHISRIYNLAQSFKNGNWDPYIYESCYLNLGYPYGIFYPDELIKPFAFLVYLGMYEYTAYIVMVFCINFVTLLSVYFVMRQIKEDMAFIVALCYFLYPYRIYDLIWRAAIGELFFFMFFPILLYGLYKLFYKKEFSWALGIGLLCILNSHILSTFLTLCFLIVFYLCNIKNIVKTPKIILHTLINAGFVLLCSLKIIIPILEAQMTEKLLYNTNSAFFGTPSYHAIQIVPQSMELMASIIVLCVLAVLLFVILNFKKKNLFSLWLLCVLLITTTNLFPWRVVELIVPFISIIQFPTRILEFAIIPYIGLCCYTVIPKRTLKQIMVFCYIIVLIFTAFIHSISQPCYNRENMIWTGIGQCDYLNAEFDALIYENDYSAVKAFYKLDKNLTVSFDEDTNLTTVKGYLPKIYYRNYKITDMNNVEYKYISKNGLIFIPELENQNTLITISYAKTFLQTISEVISNITFLMFFVFIICKKYNIQKQFYKKI